MIKSVGPAQHHPTNRSLEDFRRYWGENHGPFFANTKKLRRYVQHLTLPEAYGINPAPTFDGVSMFWYDDLPSYLTRSTNPEDIALQHAVHDDDAQLFDRIPGWPTHLKRANVVAEERVILEGETKPEMVKAVFIVAKRSGLTLNEFFDHWQNYHSLLVVEVPGLRRYVQNHGIPEAYAGPEAFPGGGQTHDGWAELWFDDLPALHRAVSTPEWRAVRRDAATLFSNNTGVVIARERIQKDLDWTYKDWGVGALDEGAILQRLKDNRYTALAADPDAPAKIKNAAAKHALAIWTDQHLVTIDESGYDARPDH